MKYLFIGAHADDIELCAGGTVAKLIEQGHKVRSYTLSNCLSNEISIEWENAKGILGLNGSIDYLANRTFDERRQDILHRLIEINRFNADYVFTHSVHDNHQDHKVVAEESIRAFKYNNNLLTYIAPWNQTGSQHIDNYFVELEAKHMELKIAACRCYESQKYRPYMKESFLWAQARTTGIKCQSEYAESFQVLKMKA